MHIERTERRHAGTRNRDGQSMSGIVTTGLFVQRRTGTVGAIEYLKANGVHGAVIQRVLAGTTRREDWQALREPDDVHA